MIGWPAAATLRAPWRRAVTAAVAACALLCAAGPALALALPDAVRDNPGVSPGAWTRWGSGEMRWLGIALYQATLYVAGNDAGQAPLALRLEYRRDIPGARLVQASMEEMRRLGADPSRLPDWEAQLQRLFPDVRKGDTITGVRIPGHGVRFFHQDRLRGELADAEFGRWFFAIWLHPDSRNPGLRSQLLQAPRKPS